MVQSLHLQGIRLLVSQAFVLVSFLHNQWFKVFTVQQTTDIVEHIPKCGDEEVH